MWQLLAVAGVLSLVAALPLAFKRAEVWRNRTVLALGDSLTANPAYCAALRAALAPSGSTAICKGYVGQGSAVVASHLDEAWKAKATDVVILAGVNDLASGRKLDQIEANLTNLYTRARQANLRVVALTVTPWAGHSSGSRNLDRTEALNAWILSSPLPDVVVDTSVLGDHLGRLLPLYDSGDGLHMTPEGAEDFAALVVEEAF